MHQVRSDHVLGVMRRCDSVPGMCDGSKCLVRVVLRRIQAKYVGKNGQLGGCPPAAEAGDLGPEPAPEPGRGQEQGRPGDGGRLQARVRGPLRRRLGSCAEFMSAEVAKLKEANGEDYEPSADDIDRMRSALAAQQQQQQQHR